MSILTNQCCCENSHRDDWEIVNLLHTEALGLFARLNGDNSTVLVKVKIHDTP